MIINFVESKALIGNSDFNTVTAYEFWLYWFTLLDMTNDGLFTNLEIKVISYFMSLPEGYSLFSKECNKYIRNEFMSKNKMNTKYKSICIVKKELLNKGIIVEKDNEFMLSDKMKALRDYVLSKKDETITFTFNFKLQ